MISFFRHSIKFKCAEGPPTEVSREETLGTCSILGFGHFPQIILTSALSGKTIPGNGEGDRVCRGEKSEIANCEWPCEKKIVYFFSCCQKSVTGDVKKWKNEKTSLSPKNHLSVSCCASEVK